MRFVAGEGPKPCDLMFIGEGPGWEEDKYGRPFVGKSGRELDRYILHHLYRGRDSVYVTNLVKYRVAGDGDPSMEDVRRDAATLEQELEDVKPDVVVTVGQHSSRYLLGDVDMEVVHGIPRFVTSRGFVVHPIIHPAAGLHSTEYQALTYWDFQQLKKLLDGEIEPNPPEDGYPDPHYYLHNINSIFLRTAAVDTEGSIKNPWCITATNNPGNAICIRKGNVQFDHVVLHNSMHDIGVLRSMGATYETFDDTMVMAYLLCVEPQGLKPLAKRHCGMEMMSYEEVIGAADKWKKLQWIMGACGWLSKDLPNESTESRKTSKKGRKSTSADAGKKSKKTSKKTAGSKKSSR